MKREANHGRLRRAVVGRIDSFGIKALMPLPSILCEGPDQEQEHQKPSHGQPEEHGRNVRRGRRVPGFEADMCPLKRSGSPLARLSEAFTAPMAEAENSYGEREIRKSR